MVVKSHISIYFIYKKIEWVKSSSPDFLYTFYPHFVVAAISISNQFTMYDII